MRVSLVRRAAGMLAASLFIPMQSGYADQAVFEPLRIKSSLQIDMQAISGSDAGAIADGFFPRQARPALGLGFGNIYGLQIMPVFGDFSGILDAYVDASFTNSFKVRLGRFRPSFAQQSLQPAALVFSERAFPTGLAPNREIGGQINGEILGRTAGYDVAVFGGTVLNGFGTSVNGSDSSGMDLVGRLSTRPFRNSGLRLTEGLGLGLAFDYQIQNSNTGPLSFGPLGFRSPGQRSFVSNSYDVYTGAGQRISPQLYYHNGPFGMLGEYIFSEQIVKPGPTTRAVGGDAFQVQVAWAVSTRSSSLHNMELKNSRDWRSPGMRGAVQLLARYSELAVNNDAFTDGLLDVNRSARSAKDFGVGLNWYPDRNIKVQLNYDQTNFQGGASFGTNRPDEKTLFSRMQLAF